jgi:hypothetical protein
VPNPDVAWNRAEPLEDSGWRRFTASLPMRTALLGVAAVWLLGAVWSFTEQSAFAGNKGFSYPHLLPLVIDGFAVAMAGVAWAASLDARPAVAARLATVIAVAASSASNGAWAYLRTHHDLTAVVLGVAVPIAANLAFEVLLAEMRRQVQRRRGLPPPVAIPYPRLIRLGLAPFRTFVEWRALVLDLTQMDLIVARAPELTVSPEPAPARAAPSGPARTVPTPSVASADGAPAGHEPVRPKPPVREPVRHEPPVREPVGIERVRRELAQYSEVARQEPVRQGSAGYASEGYESGGRESGGRESVRREPVTGDNRHEPAAPVQVNGVAHTQEPPEQPTRLPQPPPGRSTAARSASAGSERPGSASAGSERPGSASAGSERAGSASAGSERAGSASAGSERPGSERPASHSGAGRPAGNGRASRGSVAPPAAQNGHPVARRRDLEAVPAAAPARLSAAQAPSRTSARRRAVDPRVELLAAHLASTEDAGEFTGEMVGPLLNIDVAPRTGRRLLGLARELVNERSQSATDPRDDELSAAIGGG